MKEPTIDANQIVIDRTGPLTMKHLLCGIFAATLLVSGSANGAIVISGVVDGTDSGGNPKAIELVATTAISDLSSFFILRDTNGTTGGPFTVSQTLQLPGVSLAAGDFFYVYANETSETLLEGLGFGDIATGTALRSNIANLNGDDIFAVSTSTNPLDAIDGFGMLGQDDTDFYADSVAYRVPNSPSNPAGSFNAGNFNLSPYSEVGLNSAFGSYRVTAVPEPTSLLAMVGLGLAGGWIRRRRKCCSEL